jgi:tripartite-type tricarboxylate transporter receptor subunit TctC
MRTLMRFVALTLIALGGVAAQAEDFPVRPITIVNPLTAGSGVDVMTRLYADAVAREVGQRVLVENKTGSGGVVAALTVKDARPDGYTLLLAHIGTHAILSSLQTLPYDPAKDFAPITLLFYFPTYLVVPAASPAKSAADLIALAKARPGGVRLASQGVGSGTHILGAIWQDQAKAPIEHIPYRGSGQIVPDLLAGRVDLSFMSYLTIRELARDGKLRILAIASPTRWSGTPDVPTMAEAGYPGVDQDTWFGLAAPAETPKPVVAKLFDLFVKASSDPALVKRAGEDGVTIATSKSPQAFGEQWTRESERWGKVVRALNLKAE